MWGKHKLVGWLKHKWLLHMLQTGVCNIFSHDIFLKTLIYKSSSLSGGFLIIDNVDEYAWLLLRD